MGFEWIDESGDLEKPFTALMAADACLRQNAEANLLAFRRLLTYFQGIDLKGKSEDARMVVAGIMEGLEKRIAETEKALKSARGEIQ